MPRGSESRRGGVLVVALIAVLLALTLAFAATSLSTSRSGEVVRSERDLQARAAAESGVQHAIAWAQELTALDASDPFGGIDRLAGVLDADGVPIPLVLADLAPLASAGRTFANYSVEVTARAEGDARDLRVTSTGRVASGGGSALKATVHAVVRIARRTAPALEHAYFVDHWAWLWSDRISLHGNGGSNGQFDCGGRSPTITGMPRFGGLSLADPRAPDLLDYQDDNRDGVHDGKDGGMFSAWDIVGAERVRGNGGETRNQHPFVAPTAMPPLADLTAPEAHAVAMEGSIALDGGIGSDGKPLPPIPLCDAVLGDGHGEVQNLVLIGTTNQPIVLNGPVVVRGDLILKGVITGRGSIHAGGNIYIAGDLTYLKPPAAWPSALDEATLEKWLAASVDADFCGLFARENVVIGNFTDWYWRDRVKHWLEDPANDSSEDAGCDGIPNTADGKDGIAGTADDDPLEGDGVFTVERYTELHEKLGLLPPGRTVGDAIPGTGEDKDGDGVFDAGVTLDDFELAAALDGGEWAGNLPAGTTKFSQISTTSLKAIDAVIVSNHAAAMASFAWRDDFHLRGALAARVEALVASNKTMQFWQDPRVLGGGLFPDLLPRVVMAPQVIAWQWTDEDLHELIAARTDANP
jgi:hypothetical protein